jgi:AraC family transcriptional regulator
MTAIAFSGLSGRLLESHYLELQESQYPAGLVQARHAHAPAYFTSVVVGAYDENIGSRGTRVDVGALLYHPPGEEHAVRFVAPHTRIFRITPRPALFEAARLAQVHLDRAPLVRSAAIDRTLAELRSAHGRGDELAPLTMDALACELIVHVARATTRRAMDHVGARRVRDMLEARLVSPPTLRELATAVGSHPMSIARAFRRNIGCSIGEYVRRRRLEEACRELLSSRDPIATVAARAGFADQAHFTRALSEAIGVTPAALRKRAS